jgi:hypothetical protein
MTISELLNRFRRSAVQMLETLQQLEAITETASRASRIAWAPRLLAVICMKN